MLAKSGTLRSIFRYSFILCLFSIFSSAALAQDSINKNNSLAKQKSNLENGKGKIIYRFDIKEEIAPPVWRMTKKAFQEAKELKADVVLIHMNTYGGLLESADSIRTTILRSPVPVWVFIDNNAASAGALISIACDSIYMRRGANIGAATVVDQEGKVVPDKYQSYMRSMMRSTAEATGRNADIAQAMVDPRVVVPGISDSTQVITFTSTEALKYGFCEAEAESINQILEINNMQDASVIKQQLTTADKIIGFLTKPFISGILIMLIIGGLYFELQSPGIGFALIVAVSAAALYFAPLYLEGLAANWEIIIFIIGLVLIAIEILVIPGFGVAGISGIALAVLGLTLSLIGNIGFQFHGLPLMRLFESLAVVVIASFLSILISFYTTSRLFGKRTIFGELSLLSTQQSNQGYIAADMHHSELVGKSGIAHTVLRPAGKVEVEGDVYDAVAQTGYIEKGQPIKIIRFENAQFVVRKV